MLSSSPPGPVKAGGWGGDTGVRQGRGPGSNYGVIGTLRNNDKVEIIKEVDGWYEIKFNGKVGYASKSYITLVNEGSNNGNESGIKEGTVYGVSTNLNVRTGPGTSYQVIGYLLSGDKVKIDSSIRFKT